MAIELNHTIVPAHDPLVSARFLASILGLPVGERVAHFTPVLLNNRVTLDYDHSDEVAEHHYAFALSDAEFEAAFGRIRDADITYYADPACREAGQVYASKNGNRGTYFRDPNGHLMEILTIAAAPAAGGRHERAQRPGGPGHRQLTQALERRRGRGAMGRSGKILVSSRRDRPRLPACHP